MRSHTAQCSPSVNPSFAAVSTVDPTAITASFDLFFKYKMMHFGLRNAGTSFQRQVNRAIRDCEAAFAWVDTILICSRTHEEQVGHMRQVLQALLENGLFIPMARSVCGVSQSWTTCATRFWHQVCYRFLPHGRLPRLPSHLLQQGTASIPGDGGDSFAASPAPCGY